jgi:hypothetical protein
MTSGLQRGASRGACYGDTALARPEARAAGYAGFAWRRRKMD